MRETDRHRKRERERERERENEGVEGVAILHGESVSYLLIKLSDVKFSPSDCALHHQRVHATAGAEGGQKAI